jgi:hypothetical protein
MQGVFRKMGSPRSRINAAPQTLPYRDEQEIGNLFKRLGIPIKHLTALASCRVVQIWFPCGMLICRSLSSPP